MADKINEIISPEAFAQLEKLTADLNESAAAMKQLSEYARGLDFSKAKSLSDLGQWAQDYEKNLNAMSAANQNYANNLQKAIVLKQQLNGSTKSVVDTYDKLEAAELKAAKAAEIRERTAQKAAAETEKAAKREEKALRELNNEYELLKRAYKDAADKAKELGITFGTNSKIFKDAASNAKVMYDRLLKVEMAVGQGQRAVGQYNQAAFAMQQILRETPSFAYGLATGISAISNNLPILIDAIKAAKTANVELVASGGKAIPIWKTLGKELLSFGGISSILIGAATIIAMKWDDISEAFGNGSAKLKEFNKAAHENVAAEKANIQVLLSIAKDTEQSMNIRLEAVKKLQEQYPNYLGNISKEKILTGDTADEVERLNKALLNKAIMEGYVDKVKEQTKTYIELNDQLVVYQKKLQEADTKFRQYNNGSTNQYAVNARVRAAQDSANAEREIKNIEKKISATEKAMQRYQNLANKFGGEAAPLTLGNKPKTTKPKESKDTTLKSESDLLQAIYDNKQKELEITRDTNKAIADDTTKEMADRLVAHENYLAAVLELARNERDRVVDLEGEKLDEIDRLKEKAKGKELANLIEQQRAAMIRVNTAQMEFNGKQKEVVEKGQKETLAIVYSSNEQWIKSEEFRNEKLKELQIGLFLQDSELLKRQLQNKEITQKQYNDKMKQLRQTEGVMLLNDDIALYEKILANDQITAEKRLEIQKKLNQAMKAKSQMSEGQPMRKSGRITDSLGMMLGLGSEDELQAFYDNAVNLANTAADAIIEANQRQYAAQQAMLDDQLQKVRNNYDMQLNLIEVTKMSEEERANKVAKLNSQRAEQEAAIEEKKKQAAIRQAKFEKAATVASIIGNTAAAIMKVVKQLGVASPPLVALVAATGAVQLASALAAPIPAYKEGTDNHIGGAFIAGDGGEPELIVAPNKRPYWSNSVSTLYNEGAGTKVIPMSDIMQYTTTNTEDFSAAQLDALATRIAKSFDKTGYKIAQVMQATKPQINMDAIAQQMRRERNLQGK